jgi:AcrR family transcriptional regulator
MSEEMPSHRRRPYRKRRRAQQEDETRLRITEAAVELHGSVGPAKTTISAVAERAGVQRATVYRHFSDEAALFQACSSHWLGEHPLPDLSQWTAIDDPDARLRMALADVYAWHERGEDMLERVIRDVALVPALGPPMKALAGWFDSAVTAVVDVRAEQGDTGRRVRAAVGHAMTFETWRSLVREQGLAPVEAVDLMTALVALAARDPDVAARVSC